MQKQRTLVETALGIRNGTIEPSSLSETMRKKASALAPKLVMGGKDSGYKTKLGDGKFIRSPIRRAVF